MNNKITTRIIVFTCLLFFLIMMGLMVQSVKAASNGSAPRIYMTVTGTPPKPMLSLAYNRPVTSSGASGVACDPDQSPDKVVNGSRLNIGDFWCSSAATKWIQIDLGQNYYISDVTVYHVWNAITKDFTISGIKDTGSPWSQLKTLASITNNTQEGTFTDFRYATAKPFVRYIRITVQTGAPTNQPNIARIVEVLVNGTLTP